jgi:SAM-dependent methyltransferase
MRPLPEIRGLKYPDEFVARHFFKRGLDSRPGRAVELGCGPGNNLALYGAYGWTLTGVDISPAALDDCRWNLGETAQLIEADLAAGLPSLGEAPINALLIPNLLCYLRDTEARAVLSAARSRLAPGAEVFVRTRLVDDYRFGRGVEEEADGWRLATPETGEAGLFNLFYTEARLVGLLGDTLGLADPEVFRIRFDNRQAGRRIPGNSDIVIWGAAS